MTETWWVSADKTTASVTGRTLVPLSKKLNPWWWLWNDQQPFPDPGQVKHTGWLGQLEWWIRNPCANFVGNVIGVNDCNYIITGTAPVLDATMRDSGRTGWMTKTIHLMVIPLPFVSYAGAHWEFYIGWRTSGGFGVKVIRHA